MQRQHAYCASKVCDKAKTKHSHTTSAAAATAG